MKEYTILRPWKSRYITKLSTSCEVPVHIGDNGAKLYDEKMDILA